MPPLAKKSLSILLLLLLCHTTTLAKEVHHYVFFNMDRQRIAEESFLSTKAFEGAQLKYTWRELEPKRDVYDFSAIRKDLAFLNGKGKRLFIHETNPANGQRPTIAELIQFAAGTLKVDYMFWCLEEPYYSGELIPFLRAAR